MDGLSDVTFIAGCGLGCAKVGLTGQLIGSVVALTFGLLLLVYRQLRPLDTSVQPAPLTMPLTAIVMGTFGIILTLAHVSLGGR